ncbi:hypothetical protein LQW54_012899 [Pestalotiopsis sp. IQ-011]
MSAGIVYEGQVPGQGGTLFKDFKFWVSQRVPMRTTWVQNIENNGGSVTKLEKQADYLIADHAKRDCPAGSYSWKWIEDSVNNGQLLNRDEYAIKVPGSESRPRGAVQQKRTRTAYTKEDDIILAKFVTRKEKQKLPTLGNLIFQEFEAKPRPEISDNEGSLSPPPQATPVDTPEAARRRRSSGVQRSKSAKRRVRFTAEQDQLLLDHVAEMSVEGKTITGTAIFQDFAKDFPEHSWQDWRDRYMDHFLPQELSAKGKRGPPSPVVTRSRGKARSGTQANEQPSMKKDSRANPLSKKRASKVAEEVAEDGKTENMALRIRPSIEDPSNTGNTPNDDSTADVLPENHELPELGFDGSEEEAAASGSPPATQGEPHFFETREGFIQSLADFAEEEGQGQVEYSPTIQGRTFDLWDLWQAVRAQKVESVERDWQKVAEDLQFDWTKLPTVHEEIRQYYEDHLLLYEEMAMAMLANVGEGDEDGGDGDDDGVGDVAEEAVAEPEPRDVPQPTLPPATANSESHFDSSPPKQPSRKRARESAGHYPESPRKRSKVGPNDEIPSTPDTKNGTVHLRQPSSAKSSRHQGHQGNHVTLPRNARSLLDAESIINSLRWRQHEWEQKDHIEINDQLRDSISSARKVLAEPETQDFQFGTQRMDDSEGTPLEDEDEQAGEQITPSQQLHSEIDAENRRRTLNRISPMPGSGAQSPILDDDEPDYFGEMETPEPSFTQAPNPLLSRLGLQQAQAKRRSLPASFMRDSRPSPLGRVSMPGPSRVSSGASTPFRQWISSTPQPQPPRRSEWMSTPQPQSLRQPQPARRPMSKAEELAEVVEYWVALGYSPDVARRSLEATTWESGLAGRVMQHLRDGNTMPTNWEGVWSPRDDENLMLIDSPGQPRDDREARKRGKAANRLVTKHGEQRMELRRKWLSTRALL